MPLLSTGMFFNGGGSPTAPAPAITVTNTDERTSTTVPNPSFATVAFGTDTPERHVVVGLTTLRTGTSATAKPSAVTIGGVAATKIAEIREPFNGTLGGWLQFWAAQPSGTSGTVVITVADNNRHNICVWSVENMQSLTPVDTNNDDWNGTSNTMSAPVDSVAGGLVLAGFQQRGTAVPTTGGITEASNTSAGTTDRAAFGHKTTAGAETVTPTFSVTSASGRVMLALALR